MANLRPVDPTVWRACAGISVQIPAIASRAYYFPHGHAEHSVSTPSFSPLVLSQPPLIHCRVLGVDYLADTETDEILVKLQLIQVPPQSDTAPEEDTANEFTSVVKILTPSDANNGGGFSVPKSCADSIFPPLDMDADPPVQTLRIKDVLGVVWEFRHIYRGTPRRHLLTTGWSKFVNSKKLVAGDSVVFMVNRRSGENFVFIRRAVKTNVASSGLWNYFEPEVGKKNDQPGKTTAEMVEEAAELAAKGAAFEIVYYPKPNAADFVVKAEKVEKSILGKSWTVGTRVKMGVETEDLSRMTWTHGTVCVVNEGSPQSSPWRMLKVKWDEPDFVKNKKNLSPWQVEYVAPPENSEFPPAKRCRKSKEAAHGDDGDRELFPMTSSSNSMTGDMMPSLMNYSSYPVGMQGARQDEIHVSGVSNFIHEKTHETCSDTFVDVSPVVEPVSTELNIGDAQLGNVSDTFVDVSPVVKPVSTELNIGDAQLGNVSDTFVDVSAVVKPVSTELNIGDAQLGNVSDTFVDVSPVVEPVSTELNIGDAQLGNVSDTLVDLSPVVEPVSTELNIGDSQLGNVSSGTQTVNFFGNEVVGQRVCNGSPEASINSFQLFGKIIHMK